MDAFAGADGPCLSEDGRTYPATNAIDGNPATAWAEGVPGNGEGESMHIQLAEYYGIMSIEIMAGYHKREDLYQRNSRPSAVTVTFDTMDGSRRESFNLEDTYATQTLVLPEVILANGLTITTGVYQRVSRHAHLRDKPRGRGCGSTVDVGLG